MKINPNGFREYDARWLFQKDIDIEGINDLGKGFGSQIIKNTKKTNPRIPTAIENPFFLKKLIIGPPTVPVMYAKNAVIGFLEPNLL